MTIPVILSHYQVRPIIEAMATGQPSVETSLDLGMSVVTVRLEGEKAVFPNQHPLTRTDLQPILENELSCFQLIDNQLEKVQFFSEALNRFYSLMPTASAPTMLVSGTPMHRIKNTNPYKDTQMKIKAIQPATGPILDTTMGLGYTASMAAETAESVTTIELDPTVVEVCRANPWSQQLFHNSKISRHVGDAFDVIETLEDQAYSRVVHDPPMFKLAGHLYSTEFYEETYRVLKGKGRLFHYIGDPKSKSGRVVTKGVIKRLQDAGFRRIKPWPQAYGVIAYK